MKIPINSLFFLYIIVADISGNYFQIPYIIIYNL